MRSSGIILAAVCTVFLTACNEQNTVKYPNRSPYQLELKQKDLLSC